MERFDKEQEPEHKKERDVKIISENCECEEGLGHKEPETVIQSLD